LKMHLFIYLFIPRTLVLRSIFFTRSNKNTLYNNLFSPGPRVFPLDLFAKIDFFAHLVRFG